MKYTSTLPITALAAFTLMNVLVATGVIPPGITLLESAQARLDDAFFPLIVLIIFLESIAYVGFYFPGQFFAVVLVIGSGPTFTDVLALTIAMVAAATAGSLVNYALGKYSNYSTADDPHDTQLKHLLLAMIHMNSLAFFMLAQGANHKPIKVVFLAGLLNLPYYLVLITATAYLSEEVMQIAENTALLYSLLSIWLAVAVYLDIRKYRSRAQCA